MYMYSLKPLSLDPREVLDTGSKDPGARPEPEFPKPCKAHDPSETQAFDLHILMKTLYIPTTRSLIRL